jgi:hypothetical protein
MKLGHCIGGHLAGRVVGAALATVLAGTGLARGDVDLTGLWRIETDLTSIGSGVLLFDRTLAQSGSTLMKIRSFPGADVLLPATAPLTVTLEGQRVGPGEDIQLVGTAAPCTTLPRSGVLCGG